MELPDEIERFLEGIPHESACRTPRRGAWHHGQSSACALPAIAGRDSSRIDAGREVDLAAASFLIEDLGLPRLEEARPARARTSSASIRPLVHVSVTTFGSFGPRARWRGGELVASAMGGVLRLTGEPDRPPVKEALDACTLPRGHGGRRRARWRRTTRAALTGEGQHVDVSVQEVAFSRNVNGVLVWQFDRRKLHRVGGALNYGQATVRCIWPLADGWCFHSLMTGRFGAPANQALSDWMDETGVRNPLRGVDWLRYNRSTLDADVRARLGSGNRRLLPDAHARARSASEGRRRGINACVVATPADVLQDPHLQARDFWSVDAQPARPAALHRRFARAPVRSAPRDSARGHCRPRGQVRLRASACWTSRGRWSDRSPPRSWATWAPTSSRWRRRTRPCLSRIDVQVSASRAGDFDDKPWFAHLNSSKRSLALDMKQPEAREVLEPLMEWADVVVENFSPGTMAKLGLDYDSLVASQSRCRDGVGQRLWTDRARSPGSGAWTAPARRCRDAPI